MAKKTKKTTKKSKDLTAVVNPDGGVAYYYPTGKPVTFKKPVQLEALKDAHDTGVWAAFCEGIEKMDQILNPFSIANLFKDGFTPLRYAGGSIAIDAAHLRAVVFKDKFGCIHYLHDCYVPGPKLSTLMSRADQITRGLLCQSPDGVILRHPPAHLKDLKVLANADSGEEGDAAWLVTSVEGDGLTQYSLSFACVARLLSKTPHAEPRDIDIQRVARQLAKGTIEIVDAEPDEKRPLPAEIQQAQREIIKTSDKTKLNQLWSQYDRQGWTMVDKEMHRPATCLVKYKDQYFLLGQDEGSYFGVLLDGRPKTVAQAFIDLLPRQYQNTPNVLRQGEWFLVPVGNANTIPKPDDCIVSFLVGDSFQLPVDDPESNFHSVTVGWEGVIDKEGNIFVCGPKLEHEEHADLETCREIWYQIVHNTAKLSVSQEGVD